MVEKKIKVLIGPSSFAAADKEPMKRLLEAGIEVIDNPFKRKLTKEELLKLLPGIIGLIAGLETLDREVMETSDLKVISRCGSGMSNVDIQAAKEMGILVFNTPLAPVTAVAELTVGCLLSLIRQIPQANSDTHDRKWTKRIGRQLKGMEVAVIGFGNIGRRVGELVAAFGARVMAVDPALSDQTINLKDAIKQADAILVHAGGEDCILGEGEFNLMKQGVYLLNAARGGLIDENALKKALDDGKVAGAWLDTFKEEPYSGPLSDYSQVILTPHIGSYTAECRKAMELEAAKNLIEAFNAHK